MPDRNGWTNPFHWVLLIVVCLAAAGQCQESSPFSTDADTEHGFIAEEFEPNPELDRRRQESFAMWMVRALGLFALLLPLAGIVCFVLTLLVVLRGNGPFAAAALLLIVSIPLLIGFFGFLQGALTSFQVIATSIRAPQPYEVADGIACGLFSPILGLFVSTPSLLAAGIGSLVRALSAPSTVRESISI